MARETAIEEITWKVGTLWRWKRPLTRPAPAWGIGARITPSPHAKPHQRRKNVAHGARRCEKIICRRQTIKARVCHSERSEESRSVSPPLSVTSISRARFLAALGMTGPYVGSIFSQLLSPWATFLHYCPKWLTVAARPHRSAEGLRPSEPKRPRFSHPHPAGG